MYRRSGSRSVVELKTISNLNTLSAARRRQRVTSSRVNDRRALILSDGWRLQYRVLRCAAEHFDEVYILGTRDASPLKFSPFCKEWFNFSGSFQLVDAAAIAQVNNLCARLSIDCVLPSCSTTTRFLTSHNGYLISPHYPVPSRESFDVLDDKWRFSCLCVKLGIPHPRTRYFATREGLLDKADQLKCPLVIKPHNRSASIGVKRIEATAKIPAEIGYRPVLVQDYIPGRDFSAFYLCRNGQITISIAYIRTPSGIAFHHDAETERYAKIIIEYLRYNGVIGFDVRRGEDGGVWFIECNPRFWYRMDLAMIAGINFIAAGCSGIKPRGSINGAFRAPRSLLRGLFTPWRLGAYDIAFLKYLARDPLLSSLFALRNVFGANHFAAGGLL
jgi:predicted ATP-grasp superfamily ATP-dependent carboligase